MDYIEKIKKEQIKATLKFKPFNSKHEGYAIIKEEFDELWEAIRTDADWDHVEEEAIQVGAMILRFLEEVVQPRKTELR